MKRKAIALLLSLFLTAGLNTVAFASEHEPSEAELENSRAATQAQIPATAFSTAVTVPEPAEPESESSEPEPESSEQEPEPSSQDEGSQPEPESSKEEPESSQPESSQPEESSEEPESSEDDQDDGDGSEPEPEEEEELDDLPYIPKDDGDLFSARAMVLITPELNQELEASKIKDNQVINGIATNGKEDKWIPVSGLPALGDSAVAISASTKLKFGIPDSNFSFSTLTSGVPLSNSIENSLEILNNGYTNMVEVKGANSSDPFPFDVKFVAVAAKSSGFSFGVELTPIVGANEIILTQGVTFGFKGHKNLYTYNSDLHILPGNSNSSKATGIRDGAQLGFDYTWVTRNGEVDDSSDFWELEAMAGDEIMIHFRPLFFEWNGPTPSKVTLTNIRGKISLRQSGTVGRVFESVELTSYKGEAVVLIKFRDTLISTKPVDFKTQIYLAVAGRRDEDSMLEMEGSFGDPAPIEYFSEDRDIDISDGLVGTAIENMSMVKIYIGDGVTLTVPHIRKGARFYGATVMSFDSYDESIFEEYPDIQTVYALHVLGLNGAGVKVEIDSGSGFHIYDKELNYLGKSSRNLPFSEKYYLSVSELDIIYDSGEEEYDYGEEEEYEPIDGDFPPSGNPNKNPGTGN